jgi:hypothetical protein
MDPDPSRVRYREKIKTVEAEQFLPQNRPWPKGVVSLERPFGYYFQGVTGCGPLYPVFSGDWIVTDSDGYRYHCSEEHFTAIHEKYELLSQGEK